jgi:Kef-type K+ transport system membrane component KefB
MALVREFTGEEIAGPTMALALGFALIAALMLGEAAERLRMPRLTGYLIFGLLCGPYVLNLITAQMARELQFVNGLAIALIALIAGLEINIGRLKSRLRAIAAIGAMTLGVMYVGLGTVFMIAWPWLPIAPDAIGIERLSMVFVLTAIVVSFSPTVTIAVIAESRARGPFSELVLAVVVLADLALILAFTFVMQFARTIGGNDPETAGLMVRLSWEIVGSLAFGALLGSLFAVYLRAIGRELTLALLTLCVLLSTGGQAWHLEPLLAALAAGLVIENIAPARADALRDAVERSALPVLVLFFVAAGASLHLDALATIGLAAVIVAVARLMTIRAGTHVGLRVAGVNDGSSQLLWMGLVSQAGVTLGLAILVAAEFRDWGRAVQTLIVAMIALHELAGPILFKEALVRAGEVGVMDRGLERSGQAELGT